ncbi:hypothetical protein AGMMS49587_02760 [Spirochaetia bacterium]|nr:hypothetical protein AGMMS49587_02760 [Spirochaetia bacterium]
MSNKTDALQILSRLRIDCPNEDIQLHKRIADMIENIYKYGEPFAKSMLEKSIWPSSGDKYAYKKIPPSISCISSLESLVRNSQIIHRVDAPIVPDTESADKK